GRVEAGVERAERGVAAGADLRFDGFDCVEDRAVERGGALAEALGEVVRELGVGGERHWTSCSMGITRTSEAPASFSRCIVSQNTSTPTTVAMLTHSGSASSEMVGVLSPGRSARMAPTADFGAFITT